MKWGAVDGLGMPFLVRGNPQGHMVGGIYLIWEIPTQRVGNGGAVVNC